MDILFVRSPGRPEQESEELRETLAGLLPAELRDADTLQEARAIVTTPGAGIDLIVIDPGAAKTEELSKFVQAVHPVPCVVVADRASLPAAIQALVRSGTLVISPTPDAHFVGIRPENLAKSTPLRAGVYIKLAKDRYVKLLNEGDEFTDRDVQIYGVERQIELFYLHKNECAALLKKQAGRMSDLLDKPTAEPVELRKESSEAMEVIVEATRKLGFTPEVQELAKKAAELTLRAIGTSPQLKKVATLLKKNEGKFITSHSVMLAELSCAVAYASGWDSAGTFVKLVMASVMHDLSLKDNELAWISDLAPERIPELTAQELKQVKLHPVKAGELASKLTGIPPDVDRIITQHHERSDGSGFPRGLVHSQIDPLSTCFIIAHELLDYFLDPPRTPATLAEFVNLRKKQYAHGNFRKLAAQLIESRELD